MNTDRIAMPLLAAAQAQKEMTHNEALTLADLAIQAVVQAVAPATVPPAPGLGQCWIVGSSPTGDWAGQAHALAGWTAGGWRFVAAFEGMQVWSIADARTARFTGGAWIIGALTATTLSIGGQQVVGTRQAHVAAPSGGSTIDAEARAALANLLGKLEAHGLLAAT